MVVSNGIFFLLLLTVAFNSTWNTLVGRTKQAIEDIPLGRVSSWEHESLNESLVATLVKCEFLRNVF